eukprot:TRINITY_DN70_c0_g1_i1.p1 TRINITY_DN70_c0_g1~~TRINITY_DN70_c0_g1_i1.p1  ORF type:complete len:132 (+),score=23.42 TRINITY_DN70_c0_g1_i1:425-820(+)
MSYSTLLVLSLCVVFCVAVPSGRYCGSINSGRFYAVNITVVTQTAYTFSLQVDSTKAVCTNEEVAYDQNSGMIKVVNIGSPSDCLGQLIKAFGIPPEASFAVQYFSTANVMSLVQSYNGSPYEPLFGLSPC